MSDLPWALKQLRIVTPPDPDRESDSADSEAARTFGLERDPDAFIDGLFRRHCQAKGAEQWAYIAVPADL